MTGSAPLAVLSPETFEIFMIARYVTFSYTWFVLSLVRVYAGHKLWLLIHRQELLDIGEVGGVKLDWNCVLRVVDQDRIIAMKRNNSMFISLIQLWQWWRLVPIIHPCWWWVIWHPCGEGCTVLSIIIINVIVVIPRIIQHSWCLSSSCCFIMRVIRRRWWQDWRI